MSEPLFELRRGDSALVVSVPHVGLALTPPLAARLTTAGRALVDTDWDVNRLYASAPEVGATMLTARFSRYVVDLNRDPEGASLYPEARTTTLCPIETFEGEPLYARGAEPSADEIATRRTTYWQPYHAALENELIRVRARHGYALLLDAHSIWGRLPLLFDGELPELNVGTNSGRACGDGMCAALRDVLDASPYEYVVDGRFKGGYITRHYGMPQHNVHALQIELNQSTYLADGSRTQWDERKAARLYATLRAGCEAMLAWGQRSLPATTTPAHGLAPSQ